MKLILISVLVFFSSLDMASAAVWTVGPRMTISESYDDNVRLSREGHEQEDYITQVNPGISILGEGRYSSLQLDYTMQNIFYRNNDKYDDTYHNLLASNKTEIIHDHLFFDASANYSQRTINLQQTSSTDNTGITDNRTDVFSYSLKPYIIQKFGQSSKLLIQHTYTSMDNKSTQLSDSDNVSNTSYIELKSGPVFNEFSWQMSHQRQIVSYNERADVKSSNSQLLFNYKLTPKVYFVGVSGYEEYNYTVLPGMANPEGSYWEAGLGWTPGVRTKLEVRQGEHYYGETQKLLFNHRTRQSSWNVNYTEEINTTGTTAIQSTAGSNIDTGTVNDAMDNVSYANVSAVYLNKVLLASVTKKIARSEFTLMLSESRRSYLERPGSEQSANATATWDWHVAGHTSIKLQEGITENKLASSESELTSRSHLVRLDHFISKRASSYFSFENTNQEVKNIGTLYRRNVYTLGLTAKF